MNLSILKKSKLLRRDVGIENRLELVSYDFGNDLIDAVTKGYGRKSSKELGLSTLGMRAIKVELKLSDILPLYLHSSINFNRSAPKMSKKAE